MPLNEAFFYPAKTQGPDGRPLSKAARLEIARDLLGVNDVAENHFATPIDLNNVPQKPYQYQEFPRMLYKHEEKPVFVLNEQELAEALSNGWHKTPREAESSQKKHRK